MVDLPTHWHVPLTQVWPLVVQLSEQELQAVLVPRVTQVPLQHVWPPEQGTPPPQLHVPLRHVSVLLPQAKQAVPKPLVPQISVPDNAVQVPLSQQPRRQVLLSQAVGVSVGVLVAVGVSVAVDAGVSVGVEVAVGGSVAV